MAKLTKSGVDFQVTQTGTLVWTSAWLTCATVPDLAISTGASPVSVDFGDPSRDNAYFWLRGYTPNPNGTGNGVETAYAYLTLVPAEYSYSDITLGTVPAAADFLRVKARVNRTTNPVADANTMMNLTPIPPANEWFMAHGGFIPLEQHHPLARAVAILNVGGTVKLRRLQSVGQDNLADDTVYSWALGNDITKYDATQTMSVGSVAINLGSYTYGSQKGQPIYYLGTATSGNVGAPMTRNYARGGSNQISLADAISLRSVYAIDLDIEPGYFATDPVLQAPGGKAALRANYAWYNTESGTTLTTHTVAGVAIGEPDASRQVLVMIMSGYPGGNNSAMPQSVTIGGVAATRLVGAEDTTTGFICASIWMANVPAGATADVVVDYLSPSVWQDSILTYVLYHLASTTPVDTVNLTQSGGTSNPSATLTTASGGFSFVCGAHLSSASAGEDQALLGGMTGPGYHAMTFIASAASFEANPTVYEAAANADDGTARTITMAAQTGRVIAVAGVALN